MCKSESDCGENRCCLFNKVCSKKLPELSTCYLTVRVIVLCTRALYIYIFFFTCIHTYNYIHTQALSIDVEIFTKKQEISITFEKETLWMDINNNLYSRGQIHPTVNVLQKGPRNGTDPNS